MKSLFTVIVILLLPMQIYGVEWTVKYPMIQPDGSVKETKISISNKEYHQKLPYLAGGWRCHTTRADNYPPTSTLFAIYCYLKVDENIKMQNFLRCTDIQMLEDKRTYRDNKENYLALHLTEPNGKTDIYIECKL